LEAQSIILLLSSYSVGIGNRQLSAKKKKKTPPQKKVIQYQENAKPSIKRRSRFTGIFKQRAGPSRKKKYILCSIVLAIAIISQNVAVRHVPIQQTIIPMFFFVFFVFCFLKSYRWRAVDSHVVVVTTHNDPFTSFPL